jgi:hypothetical protein
MRGIYVTIDADGDEHEKTGLDMNLGIGEGATVEEALSALLNRLVSQRQIPSHLSSKVIAYKLVDDGQFIDIEKVFKAARQADKENYPDKIKIKSTANLAGEKCEWCEEILPPNAAGKFSHLRKHIGQLVRAGLLDKGKAQLINKLMLRFDIRKTFEEAKAKKVFSSKII